MKIELDLDYDDAIEFRHWLRLAMVLARGPIDRICNDMLIDIGFAIVIEDERQRTISSKGKKGRQHKCLAPSS